jgi:hypothetical protein
MNYWIGAWWSGHEAKIGLNSVKMIFLRYRRGNYWVGAWWIGHEAIIGLDSFKMIFLRYYRHGNDWIGAWWSGHEAIIGLDSFKMIFLRYRHGDYLVGVNSSISAQAFLSRFVKKAHGFPCQSITTRGSSFWGRVHLHGTYHALTICVGRGDIGCNLG